MTPFEIKLRTIITASIVGLSDTDRTERIAWCRSTGQHGVTMFDEGDMIRLDWGGRTLAAVERAILADDSTELPPPLAVPEVPDDARDLTDA
ncbi:hypothetical protein [Actinomadura chokoriensis]|uniref:hypothetical protein n=1 Tax=Actinomadura chokoriensis TaxID=454156 RepID=UPI0031F8DF6C